MTTKLVVPPMPEVEKTEAEGNLVLQMYCTAVENWGQECAAIAQREAALADELAEALERLSYNFDLILAGKPVRDVAETKAEVNAAIRSHKEARNG